MPLGQFAEIIRTVGPPLMGWVAGHAIRVAVWVLLVGLGFGAVAAGLAWLVVRECDALALWLAGGAVLVGSAAVGVVAGTLLAGATGAREWIAGLALGPAVSRALFAETLGVTENRPRGNTPLAESLDGATVGEARRRLREAFHQAFQSRSLDRWLPSQGRWLMSRVVNGAGWIAAKAAIAQLPGDVTDEARFELLGFRDALGKTIDETATAYTVGRVRWLAWGVISLGATLTLVLVVAARWLVETFAA
ncbi:MAG: hypothetical protein AAGB00_05525 [Planctomycetota bacterium]